MKNSSLELLNEMIKLWKKYGEDSFKDLSDLLANGSLQNDISSLLWNYMDAVSPEKTRKKRNNSQKNTDAKILNKIELMKNTEPEKADLILLVREQLQNKNMLPTLQDIKTYFRDEKLPMNVIHSRNEGIAALITLFLSMSMSELTGHLSSLPKTADGYQRSSSRWSDIIIKKNINDAGKQ